MRRGRQLPKEKEDGGNPETLSKVKGHIEGTIQVQRCAGWLG